MRRTMIGLLVIVGLVGVPAQTFAITNFISAQTGYDISWPNCSVKFSSPVPFGIVGVNGGLNFHPNPCIGQEASWFKNDLSLYINTGYPGRPYADKYSSWPNKCSLNDAVCLAYNYGYNAGKYSANYSLVNGVVSKNWWLDVEIINSWTNNPAVNRASITGAANALSFYAGPSLIGIYAYPGGWQTITGDWQNNWPAWVASNSNYRSVAQEYCQLAGFDGGQVQLTQYIGKLDTDYAC